MADLNFITTSAAEVYNEILQELENGVSDPLYPGDERRIYGEAMVLVIVQVYNAVNDAARQKMLRYARNEVLDALGENRGVRRHLPVPATTTIRFSINAPMASNIIIPAGTRVTGDFVRYFATDRTVVLMAGGLFVDADATSEGGGESYNNMHIGEIHTLVDISSAPLIDRVENITITTGGRDRESDDSYRERIRAHPDGLSTAGPSNAYRFWAISADPTTIADVVVWSPSPGVTALTPIGFGGELLGDDTLDKIKQAVNPDDIRPLTDYVQVKQPDVIEYDIELVYHTTPENESRVISMVEGSGGAIDRYIFWQGSALNRDLNPDHLRKLILAPNWEEGLVGADRVDIIAPEFTKLDSTTVAKFSGNLTVSHTVRRR